MRKEPEEGDGPQHPDRRLPPLRNLSSTDAYVPIVERSPDPAEVAEVRPGPTRRVVLGAALTGASALTLAGCSTASDVHAQTSRTRRGGATPAGQEPSPMGSPTGQAGGTATTATSGPPRI